MHAAVPIIGFAGRLLIEGPPKARLFVTRKNRVASAFAKKLYA